MICIRGTVSCVRALDLMKGGEEEGNESFKRPTMTRTDNDSDLLANQNSLVPEEICF